MKCVAFMHGLWGGLFMDGWVKHIWERKLVHTSVVYLGVAWLLLQVATMIESILHLPEWLDQTAFVFLALGYPVALIFAWAQDFHIEPAMPEKNEPALQNKQNESSAEKEQPQAAPSARRHQSASIAVLPFMNMSDDAEKEYFADGMTEDIITRLSFSPHLMVVSRTSTFKYKEQAVDIRKIGEELKVDYVAEGSVRPIGNNLRITVQLIRAATGDHVWAEIYDRPSAELFDVQDDVINAITRALGVHLTKAEAEHAKHLQPHNLSAWEALHRNGFVKASSLDMRGELVDVIKEMKEVEAREPEYPPLLAAIATGVAANVLMGWSDDIAADFEEASAYVRRALALGGDDTFCLFYCACAYGFCMRFDEAIALCERALRVNPLFVDIYFPLGFAYMLSGRYAEAEEAFKKADEGGFPYAYPGWLTLYNGILYLLSDRLEEAEIYLNEAASRMPGLELVQILLAWVYYRLGNRPAADACIQHMFRIRPGIKYETAILITLLHPDDAMKVQSQVDFRELWPEDAAQG